MRVYNSERRILVTGGAGFLGTPSLRASPRGGRRGPVRRQLLHRHASTTSSTCSTIPRFELMRHDVTFPLYVEVDQIYNLACPGVAGALPARSGADDQDQRARRDQHARPRQARARARSSRRRPARSTAIPTVHPQPESYWGNVNPIGLRTCYDEGKRCAETLFFDYHRQHKVDIRVARIFNTYGPRMHPNDGRVVSNFIVQALRGEPITIYGEGSQTRSFCYVDDLIEGLRRFMEAEPGFAGADQPRQPGGVHDPRARGARDPADRLALQARASRRCLPTTRCSAVPTSRWRASSSAGSRRCSWRTGLKKTIDFFEQLLSKQAQQDRRRLSADRRRPRLVDSGAA